MPTELSHADEAHRFLRAAKVYQPHVLADVVVLFAMSVPYRLEPGLGLRFDDPGGFREACHRATQQVEDARFDTQADGWLYDHDALLQAFVTEGLPAIPASDVIRFNQWLEDGCGTHRAAFRPRLAWKSALRWILLKPDPVRVLPSATYQRARAFAEAWHRAVQDPLWQAALSDVQETLGDDLDALVMTKFHIVMLDDDLDGEDAPVGHSPLDWLEDIRAGGILRQQLALHMHDPACLSALDALLTAWLHQDPPPPGAAALLEAPDSLRSRALYDWSRPDAQD